MYRVRAYQPCRPRPTLTTPAGFAASAHAPTFHVYASGWLQGKSVSIALIADRFEVKWVVSQVRHADSKMTLDVYAQVEQRSHGAACDSIVSAARQQLQHTDRPSTSLNAWPARLSRPAAEQSA